MAGLGNGWDTIFVEKRYFRDSIFVVCITPWILVPFNVRTPVYRRL